MNKSDRETPGSFLALMVGIFIGALLVLPMFAYMCRVNGQLRQKNHRLRIHIGQHVSLADDDTNALRFILTKQYGAWRQGFVLVGDTLPFQHIQSGLSFGMHRRRHPGKDIREAFDDFARRNAKAHKAPSVNIGKPLTRASRSEITTLFKRHGWDAFYKKYPHTDGYLAVCLPGYSADRTTALIYIERHSACGKGELIVLQKKQGQWTRKEIITGWRS